MYLSRIQLRFNNLQPEMLKKWDSARPYASHQWLWQLFPEQKERQFLFRQEERGGFFMLSTTPPSTQHTLFLVETKSFSPQLTEGLVLDFQLRANPVITRNGKRSDVMMNAKHQAKANGVEPEKAYKGSFNVRIAPELHKTLALYSASRGQTLNAVVEEAIKHFVNNKSSKRRNSLAVG